MINAKKIEEIAKQVSESIPPGLKTMANEFEDKTKELTGDAAEQFAEWRAFLKEIYEQEKTPDKKL